MKALRTKPHKVHPKGIVSPELAKRVRADVTAIMAATGLPWQLREFVWTSPEAGDQSYIFEVLVDASREVKSGLWASFGAYMDNALDDISEEEREYLLNTFVWVSSLSAIALV